MISISDANWKISVNVSSSLTSTYNIRRQLTYYLAEITVQSSGKTAGHIIEEVEHRSTYLAFPQQVVAKHTGSLNHIMRYKLQFDAIINCVLRSLLK